MVQLCLNMCVFTREPGSYIFFSLEVLLKHEPEAGMIKRGYHGNVISVHRNIVVFVHLRNYPTSTQKMKEG